MNLFSRRQFWTGRNAFVISSLMAAAAAPAQHAGHGMHPVMPGQKLVARCRLPDAGGQMLERDLPVRPSAETRLDEIFPLGGDNDVLRVVRYVPHATLEQQILPSTNDTAPSAVQLHIRGATQSFYRWLIADDMERNRLTSFIATWRYMALAGASDHDAVFHEFENELTRTPRIAIRRAGDPDSARVLALDETPLAIEDFGLTVAVKQFLPDAAVQGDGTTPKNQSSRRRNPAVQVEIQYHGVSESRWVFAKFPKFGPRDGLPFDISLDCPVEGPANVPDYVLVSVNRSRLELWQRLNGKIEQRVISLDESIEIPGSNYAFIVDRFVPSARIAETYLPDENQKAGPAIEFEYPNESGNTSTGWVGIRQYRTISTSVGRAIVSLEQASTVTGAVHP